MNTFSLHNLVPVQAGRLFFKHRDKIGTGVAKPLETRMNPHFSCPAQTGTKKLSPVPLSHPLKGGTAAGQAGTQYTKVLT